MRPQDAIDYLLEEGLMTVEALVDGDVRVEDFSRRNLNLAVISTSGPGFFLKEADPAEPGHGPVVEREAAFYRRADSAKTYARLRAFLPAFHTYDARRNLLISDLCRGAPTLSRWLTDNPGNAPSGPWLARALAACHAARVSRADRATAVRIPWGLQMARPGLDLLHDGSPAQVALVSALQRDSAVCGILDELRVGWQAGPLIHGDVRSENILVDTGAAPGGDINGLRVVDWELSGPGDPAWDVGSAFHCYLAHSMESLDLSSVSPDAAGSAFQAALSGAHRETKAFWDTYVRAVRLPAQSRREWAARASHFCAARMLQSAYEWAVGLTTPSRTAACFLQLGLNMFHRPEDAQALIVGLA